MTLITSRSLEIMNSNELLLRAIRLAMDAHGNQLDKAGLPYILHPLYVMSQVDPLDAKILAVLHDIIEDTQATLIRSDFEGTAYAIWHNKQTYEFPEYILSALDAMTKRPGEKLEAYWIRVKAHPLALEVKLADIAHNSSDKRLAALSEDDRAYLRSKYARAIKFLTEG